MFQNLCHVPIKSSFVLTMNPKSEKLPISVLRLLFYKKNIEMISIGNFLSKFPKRYLINKYTSKLEFFKYKSQPVLKQLNTRFLCFSKMMQKYYIGANFAFYLHYFYLILNLLDLVSQSVTLIETTIYYMQLFFSTPERFQYIFRSNQVKNLYYQLSKTKYELKT